MSFNQRLWYHPESDSYYIGGPEETDDLAEDVTGYERHIENARARGIVMPVEPNKDLREARRQFARDGNIEAIGEYLKPVLVEALYEATRTCLTCDHFDEKAEVCSLYKQRPPARVIAFGCESYINDIPF